MLLQRAPTNALRPFVTALWASDEGASGGAGREHVLPTGAAHLVVRVRGAPLRVFRGPEDRTGTLCARALLGGPRATHYVRALAGAGSYGAQFAPDGMAALLGLDADELAGRHSPLADLWGGAAREAEERLAEARSPEAGLEVLEGLLLARLARLRPNPPLVAEALAAFARGASVAEAVRASGRSHRSFVELFRRAVGLAPKVHCRVQRLQRVLARPRGSLGVLALAAGYSDQAHLTREFRALTGLTPSEHRRLAPAHAHHVRVP
ncbi:MAG TPA: AraC family transcriptional regulator [Planctomycetota bacterium]